MIIREGEALNPAGQYGNDSDRGGGEGGSYLALPHLHFHAFSSTFTSPLFRLPAASPGRQWLVISVLVGRP